MDLSLLNPEQREAVMHDDGPILVLAGAGSGKTRVITTRIARLVGAGVRPDNILGVTFTNKAAAEMRERVGHLIPNNKSRKVNLGTFHSLGSRILRAEIHNLGFDKRFHILDDGDRRRVMRGVLKELKLPDRGEQRLLSIISKAKGARTTPAQLPDARFNPEMPRAQRAFDHYNLALRNLNAVDFDDLLLLPTKIFEQFPEIREKYRQKFRFVLVDEYQDTNPIQMKLLEQLVGPPHYNLMAVGDDDQSIYRFRGAVADNILRFADHFHGAKVVALEQNYRSKARILKLANAVIERNAARHKKTLWSDLGEGRPVEIVQLKDDWAESDYIARQIKQIQNQLDCPYERFAILYRSNSQTTALEESLRKFDVPYRILGGQSMFDRKEIKDVVAYAQLVLNPRDDLALRRIINFPTRGVGTTTLARLDERSKQGGHRLADVVHDEAKLETGGSLSDKSRAALTAMYESLDKARRRLRGAGPTDLSEILRDLIEDLVLERAIKASEKNPNIARIRWQNVTEMLDRVSNFTEGDTAWKALEDWVQLVALETSAAGKEKAEDLRNKVTLTTMHSSKGLEFPIVFLCGASDDLLPHAKSIEEGRSAAEAEERRLCYVGITRAKERLFITWARIAHVRNERIRRKRSRFLEDLPEDLWVSRESNIPSDYEKKLDEKNSVKFEGLRALLDK